MRLARTVRPVEARRRMTHLTHPAYRRRDAGKPPISEAVQIGEVDGAFTFRCENLLPDEEDVTTHVRVVAVETGRAWQRRCLMHLCRQRPCRIVLVAGGDVARRQRLARLFAPRGHTGDVTKGAVEIEVYDATGRGERRGGGWAPSVTWRLVAATASG